MLRVMCYVFCNKKAFTLIELLVVVTVILIISAISFPKYNDFTESKRLESDAKQLIDVVDLARKKSMSSDLYSSCTNFNGYSIDVNSTFYTLNFICNNVSQIVQKYNFSSQNFIDASTLGAVTFFPVSGTVKPVVAGDTNPTKTYILKNSGINKAIQISISRVGVTNLGNIYDY